MSRLSDRLEDFVRRGQSAQHSADEILIREKIDRALMERGGKALFRGMEAPADHARFDILAVTDELTLIRDIGPWTEHPSVTNDAENVVRVIAASWLQPGARLFYFDSGGRLDELLVQSGRFAGFAPGLR